MSEPQRMELVEALPHLLQAAVLPQLGVGGRRAQGEFLTAVSQIQIELDLLVALGDELAREQFGDVAADFLGHADQLVAGDVGDLAVDGAHLLVPNVGQ